MLNGVTQLFMMKADVLSGIDDVEMCNAYSKEGETTTEFPFSTPMHTNQSMKESMAGHLIHSVIMKACHQSLGILWR